MKAKLLLVSFVAIVVLAGATWVFLDSAGERDTAAVKEEVETQLFTGKEETVEIKLYFVQVEKSGFGSEMGKIYLSASRSSRVKQVLKQLFDGPKSETLVAAFPATAEAREVFVDNQGLCVIDLNRATSVDHPGGTTAEYQSLYTLFRTLKENFPEIKKVQVMVEGEQVDSLAGHLDLMDPLTSAYF